jgi:hypothetical protein
MSLIPASIYGLYGYGGYGIPIAPLVPAEAPQATPAEKVEVLDPVDRNNGLFLATGRGWFPGFDKAPPPGINTWWMMRRYATNVLAYSIVTAPVLAGTQGIETVRKDDTEAEKWKEQAEAALLPRLLDVLPAAMESLNFGAWLQEPVWGRRDGRIDPVEFNSFLPGEAVLYRDRGRKFAGYKIGEEFRDTRYAFLAVSEPHMDRIFGYSRNENCREEWWRARKSEENADRVEGKASGIQMKIGLPMGASFTDANNQPIVGKDIAQAIVDAAVQGQTFTVPLTPFRKDDIKNKPELADIEAVKVEAFDWKDNAASLLAHLARMARIDKMIMRAWHRPEREAMEGQNGTKAEAGTHGAIGTTDSELVAASILRQWDCQITDRWLVTNFGPEAIGRIKTVQAPLSDPQQEFLQQLTLALTANTQTGGEVTSTISIPNLLKRVEAPQLSPEEAARKKVEIDAQKAQADKAKAESDKARADAATQLQGVPVRIAASAGGNGNGHKMGAVELFNRVLELGRDE